MILDPSQQAAVELMLSAPIGVVTGGPGTGKTTITRAALDRMDARGESYLLAAPTGKAARRMEEATGRKASTIHRLLGYGLGSHHADGFGGGFLYGVDEPLEANVIVIDEASMIDIELAQALLEAVHAPSRILFVGDAAQLPSVGPGRVLCDLIESGEVPVARLTKVHRAAAESWVCSQAPEVLAGQIPDLGARADFHWLERDIRDHAVDAVVGLVAGGGPYYRGPSLRELGVEDRADVQVLVPQNVGRAGTGVLNRRLQALLNPAKGRDGWRVGGKSKGGVGGDQDDDGTVEIRIGDRVIQTRNDYLLDVMNGEVGVVEALTQGELVVRFDEERRVSYSRDSASALRLAYALTVHKYQGSEVPWAVVLCHSTHTRMLTRQLLYTAITRAKKGVVLVGDRLGIERAVKNERDRKRYTGLVDRLREERSGEERNAA